MTRIPQKGRKARWEELQSIAATDFTGSYVAVGVPTSNPGQIVFMYNNTNQDVVFSFDGVTDMGVVPTLTWRSYNLGANTQDTPNMECMELPANTQLYVNAAMGTGTFYFELIYQSSV